MKHFFCLLTCLFLILSITACQTNSRESNTFPKTQLMEKYVPRFMSTKEGVQELKTSIYGTEGWSLVHKSPYIFALVDRYVLRYNINDNKIDKFINLGEAYKSHSHQASISSNGRYCLSYAVTLNIKKTYNYQLIDLENETSTLICESYDTAAYDNFPDEIKEEIKSYDVFRFNQNNNENFVLVCKDDGVYYQIDNGSEKNLSSIKDYDNYCVIDNDRIAVISAVDKERSYLLGYYKITVIDIKNDKVLNEYIFNK